MKYLLPLFLLAAPMICSAQNCSRISSTLESTAQDVSAARTILKQTNTYRVVCVNTQNGAIYLNVPMSVYALGSEGPNGSGGMLSCNAGPFETHVYVAAVGGSANNSVTAIGHNNTYASHTSCYLNGYQTQTTYCVSKACTGTTSSGCTSPIVLDVDGQGYSLTDAIGGIKFDIGDGKPKQMGWTAADSGNAFLALPGADGMVHSGQQLFGNFTPQPPSEKPNGFLALAVYDSLENGGNGDGVIDAGDGVFSLLRLWVDENHDGISQPNELHTLPELGVYAISLKYHQSGYTDRFGNIFRYQGIVNPNNPRASNVDRKIFDVYFVTDTLSAKKKKVHLLMVGFVTQTVYCN